MKSQVNFVKNQDGRGAFYTQPMKDVSISIQLDRDLPITSLKLCEFYPDARLNTTMTQALYTFTIFSLMDVWTTWAVQTTRYCVRELFHLLSFPDVSPLMSPASSTSSIIYSGVEQKLPRLHLAFTITDVTNFLALGVKKGPGEGGHGDTGRREDKKDKLGCATVKSSSYCCTALGSSPQPQPVPISRVATSVLSLNTLLRNTLSSRSHLIPV